MSADSENRETDGWTTAAGVVDQLTTLWSRGRMLAARLANAPLFPMSIRFRKPTTAQLGARFEDVREWIRQLEAGSKSALGYGYDIDWIEVQHRQLGRNRMPSGLTIQSEGDALRLISKVRDADRFRHLVVLTQEQCPELIPWLARKPLVALAHADDWSRIIDVLTWFRANPRSGRYLRQLDIPGVDTKFIEERKGVLSELLDCAMPNATKPDTRAGLQQFEARQGLRTKPPLVRFRILDPRFRPHGLSDLTVPAGEFAQMAIGIKRVFVTENEINGLAFPDIQEAIVIFGLGYSVDLLADSDWLNSTLLFYWGDIDTHGFAILDRVRAKFSHARSLLMDRETLMTHRALWVHEETRHTRQVGRLTEAELAVYNDLQENRLGVNVRLEQERIGFRWVERALAEATAMYGEP